MTTVSLPSSSRSTPSRSTLRNAGGGNNNNSTNNTTSSAQVVSAAASAVIATVAGAACGTTSNNTGANNPNRRGRRFSGRDNDKNSTTAIKRAIASFCIGIVLVVCGFCILFAGKDNNNDASTGMNGTNIDEVVYFKSSLDTFPSNTIELWPDYHYHHDSSTEEKILDLYYDCIPVENADCQERMKVVDTTDGVSILQHHTVAILRTPGIFGEIVEQFVQELIDKSDVVNENNSIEFTIIKTSHIDPENYEHYTKVIRPVILPFLLEATDLALRSTGNDDNYHPTDVTMYDLLGIVRQIIRWNVRISHSIGKDTALYSIPFDKIMAYPTDIEKEIRKFLKLYPVYTKNKNKIHHVKMDKLAEKVIQRVDACNALLMRIMKDESLSSLSVHVLVDHVIQEELVLVQQQMKEDEKKNIIIVHDGVHDHHNQQQQQHDLKNNPLLQRPLRGRPIQHSRATDLVGYFLDRTENLSEKICLKYPKSFMCLADTSDKHVKILKNSAMMMTTTTTMHA